MKDVKYKKVKISPHSRDRITLFSRDFDKDLYVENIVWDPNVFELRAYPENEEKYTQLRFNQQIEVAKPKETIKATSNKHIEEVEPVEEVEEESESSISVEEEMDLEQALADALLEE